MQTKEKATSKTKAKAAKPQIALPPKKQRKKVTSTKVKPINGEKNGKKRIVQKRRAPRLYQTQEKSRLLRKHKKPFSQHKRHLRPSITPGTILILLAGRHKGKRVVFLKQLKSGLLLVTGPYHLNGCPLRRINQIYVIATKSKLDIGKANFPERLTDKYFTRKELKRPKNTEGEIFDSKKEVYSVSDERKEDQVNVDQQILQAIRARADKKLFFGYLGAMFSIKNREYPHKMLY